MNATAARSTRNGLTLPEVLVVVAVVAMLFVIVLAGVGRRPTPPPKAQRIMCINNLKQIGLAYRIWSGDQTDRFPMEVPIAKGGTMEFINGTDTFRHYLAMSNELSTPKILVCSADTRTAAADFAHLGNRNISYFVGLDAKDTHPQMPFLSGDRNITGPAKPENGILKLRPGDKVGWTAEIHVNQGNIGLADGSVQSWSNAGLEKGLQNSGDSTNVWRLAVPE